MSEAQKKQVLKVRAGAPSGATPTPVQAHVMHRVDASQLAANDVVFSEPPEFKSTTESRAERIVFWRRAVAPVAIVTTSVIAALVIVFFK